MSDRIIEVDDVGNPTTITVANNPKVNTEIEIISLEDSELEIESGNDVSKNLDINSTLLFPVKEISIVEQEDSFAIEDKLMNTTTVQFDRTLPPGAAPEGFLLVDEDVNSSKIINSSQSEIISNIDKFKCKEPDPIFKIVFRDHSAVRKYRDRIEEFFKRLIRGKRTLKFSLPDHVLRIYDGEVEDNNSKLNQHEAKPKSSISDGNLKQNDDDMLFTVDTDPMMQDDLDIPVFERKFKKTLEETKETDENIKIDIGPKMSCFNCLGNHSLKDCTSDRDYIAIAKNRKDYNARKGSGTSRYHLEDDQRFGHYTPGMLSSSLRKALGIQETELPSYIYRMRRLGYPPGWLEEARLQHSGLSLFNSEGIAEAGGSDEEGEVYGPGDKDKYDINKLIDFPGFNTEIPPQTQDEFAEYWGSDLQIQNSKKTMLIYYSTKKAKEGYKRKKLQNTNALKISQNVNSGEMEIEEVEELPVECVPAKDMFIPPLPKDNPPLQELPPPPPALPSIQNDSVIELDDSDIQMQENVDDGEIVELIPMGSPSLTELEIRKNKLLAELQGTSSPSIDSKNESSSPSNYESSATKSPSVINVDDTKHNSPRSPTIPESSRENLSELIENSVTPQNPRTQNLGLKPGKILSLGTPILKSSSPYSNLPSSEKFSKNICDVINFENLPDSTGKYDNLVGILQKVRTTLAELHNE